MPPSDQTRLLIVEDVPQVAQYIRGLLNAQSRVKLLDVLSDGSLQFGDLRSLLKVPVDAPSILDLPTDRIAESDLSDVLWRDPSGIDILLAPPRIEMAEMLTPRDVEKVLSLLRRVYAAIACVSCRPPSCVTSPRTRG